MRRIRIIAYCPWGSSLQEAASWLKTLPSFDLTPRISNPADPKLRAMARLDCDWHAESVRCFSHLESPELSFLPTWVLSRESVGQLLSVNKPLDEEWWYVTYGQHPQALDKLAGPFFGALAKRGIHSFYYAFDEASRTMPCFKDIAPFLSVLVHDESPLDPAGEARLNPRCKRVHRSWVANLLPFSASFNEEPEEKLLFLGSEMGLTDNRKRQVAFLRERLKDRFVASHDHSVAVGDRLALSRFKASLCPEGRKFASPAMARSHTDRPFWSGCLGLVPVSENSAQGGRLDALQAEGLLLRYEHADLVSLLQACEEALSASTARRRRIYEHYNRRETVGQVLAELIAAYVP